MKQKFHKGDLVRIAKDLGPTMNHFDADCEAIIVYSFAEKYGGGNTKGYCLCIKNRGKVSWYNEHQLTLIKSNQINLLVQWEKEIEEEVNKKGNIDWIFSNGKEVLKYGYVSSVQTLAGCLNFGDTLADYLNFGNIWGNHGEGFDLYFNTINILKIARPFLKKGSKEEWLKYCINNKRERKDEDVKRIKSK